MTKSPRKRAEAGDADPAKQYRVELSEPIRVAGVTLRPGQRHVISAKAFEANKDKVSAHEEI